MAQKDRNKKFWLIPKRVNLHQTICLIDGIIERNYDGTSWNPQKQNNLGVNLKNWGATKDGKNISPQAIRTLVASIPQYLGFLYINTEATTNKICFTPAGIALWERHKGELVKVKNLVKGDELLIKESDIVLHQMEKLIITNPVISKDCENICMFPFRFMLELLLRVEYLDIEEIAYFLFATRAYDDLELAVRELERFRGLTEDERKILIDDFKSTHIGNITLVKAPSAGYYISLCCITGIIEKIKVTPDNKSKPLTAIKIKPDYIDYVNNLLYVKYAEAKAYDFGDDLSLWIDYMGEPERELPPIDVALNNCTDTDLLLQIYSRGTCKYADLLMAGARLEFPMFTGEEYVVKIINTSTGDLLKEMTIVPSYDEYFYDITGDFDILEESQDFASIAMEIINHCNAKSFAGKTADYLQILQKTVGIDKTKDKSLRGAYFEYYFFKLLTYLKNNGVVDEVVWNGKIGKYGLPTQAPGGRTGTPDIVFKIDESDIVLELTTIKSKALQFTAEASSVPDHIRLYKEETNGNVAGVFCAPVIHTRNTDVMKSTLSSYKINLKCLSVEELINIFSSMDRDEIKSALL